MIKAQEQQTNIVLVIIITYLMFLGGISSIGYNSDKLSSLIFTIFFGFISVLFLSLYAKQYIGKGYSLIYLLLAAFFIKISTGVIHFLLLVQPDYFLTYSEPDFLSDYLWFHHFIKYIAEYHIDNGFWSLIPAENFLQERFNKSFFLAYFTSNLYYFSGAHFLNISIFNTLFSLYTSVIIGILTLKITNNKQYAYNAVFLTAFQGFSMISSIMMRDIVGQFFITLAVFGMYSFRQNILRTIIFFPIARLLFFSQRNAYALVPVIAYIFYFVFFSNYIKKRSNRIAIIVLTLPVLLFMLQYLQVADRIDDYSKVEGFQAAFRLEYWFYIPFNILKGLLGPFPWVQFFEFQPNTILQIADYYQAIFNFALLIFIVPILKKKFRSNDINIILLTGLVLFFYGILSGFLNSTYINIGLIFLIPTVAHISLRYWYVYFTQILIVFLILNSIYVGMGFYGTGLTDFLRANE